MLQLNVASPLSTHAHYLYIYIYIYIYTYTYILGENCKANELVIHVCDGCAMSTDLLLLRQIGILHEYNFFLAVVVSDESIEVSIVTCVASQCFDSTF